MTKNEYRRSLILLRSNESGYSGHVRMERRVTAGNMVFVLQTPQAADDLRAALIGRDKRGYYACAIGDIRRDAHGQGTLTFAFDPRNICGRELDMYRLIAVVRTSGGSCAIVLLGNLNGYADMDLSAVANAACDLYGMADAAVPVPLIADAPLPVEEIAPDADVQAADAVDPPEEAQATEPVPADAVEPNPPAREAIREPTLEAVPESAQESAPQSAQELINLASDAQWPTQIEGARQYFMNQSPAEDVPDDDYIYVRVPVEGEAAHMLIGVRAETGRIAGIAYALPADYAADPPEGLSDFHWQGDDRAGWWVLRIDVPPDAQP